LLACWHVLKGGFNARVIAQRFVVFLLVNSLSFSTKALASAALSWRFLKRYSNTSLLLSNISMHSSSGLE